MDRTAGGAAMDAGAAKLRSRRMGVITTVALLVGALLVSTPVDPAAAAGRRITPEFFGIQDDLGRPNEPGAWRTARMYAKWCMVQPTASADAAADAERALGRAFRTNRDLGVTRLTVAFGHPAPWVFGDHPAAVARSNRHIWFCGGSAAGGTVPKASALRSGPIRDAYVTYVAGVITAARTYLDANPANTLVLQAWNEPNLRNGAKITRAIPRSARSWKQAARSLQEQERILRRIASSMIPGRFEITSPSMYGKRTTLGKHYFRYQAKKGKRTIDSVSLNFYTLREKSMTKSIARWRQKAVRAKRVVTKHKRLRKLPIWITETNHNLINGIPSTSNVDGFWATERVQRRLVEVTTMEALRLGFAGIGWYQGSPRQTAVNVQQSMPATAASIALRNELLGRKVRKCKVRRKKTTCWLTARPGSRSIKVSWSKKGSSGVRIR
jgi:hypothetical protein